MENIIKNKNYILLMLVQTIEQIGDSLILMALIAWVMSMEAGSKTANMTILLFWIGLPIILIGPFSGVIIDRFKRKNILATATFMKGVFIFLIYLCVKRPELTPLLYVLVFMKSFSTQFFVPAKSAIMPDIVTDKQSLIKANSISTTAMVITQITTYAITGVVLAEFGTQKVMLTSALLYIPAVVLVLLIGAGETAKKGKIESFKHIANDLSEGFKFMLNEGQIKFVTRRVFFMMVAVMVFYISLTGGALEHMLSAGGIKLKTIGALGFMQAVLGLGLVAGVMITEKLVNKIDEKSIIKYAFPVFGTLIIGLYFLNNYYFLLTCAFGGV